MSQSNGNGQPKTAGKLCECGCGGLAPISRTTRRGILYGGPCRYIRGHQWRTWTPKHYKTVADGSLAHVAKAERALGKPLPAGAQVHHADGTKSLRSPLVICQDETYHRLLHARMRVKRAGGNPNTDKICSVCREVKPKTAFGVQSREYDGLRFSCRECHSREERERHRRKVAA